MDAYSYIFIDVYVPSNLRNLNERVTSVDAGYFSHANIYSLQLSVQS